MGETALAIAFAVFAWWFSTGVILALVRTPQALHPYVMAGLSFVMVLALIGLNATREDISPAGAYAGFTYGLIVWAWLETAFLLGYITGPVTRECPPNLSARQRFVAAFGTIAYHEISILLAAIVMVVISWGAANPVGTLVFLILWAMRVSAKLNIFAGAPNVSAEFLPEQLAHLASYFNRGRIGWFFVASVTVASLALGLMIQAVASTGGGFAGIGLTLSATLLALAIIEHWFLVLPIPDAVLWRWATGKRQASPKLATIAPVAVVAPGLDKVSP